ncbi:KASH5 protein, partial [Ibidorhyncha struthersii]|nr:KASH5 protein [Ibidorhyncha struthersii]
STQQALEQARGAAEELEDMKAMVEELQEQNGQLRRQARQLVRRSVSSLPTAAEVPSQHLLTEGRGTRERIQALAAETADLEVSG